MSLARGSILFNRVRQLGTRTKSTFTYESDKTFSQRWLDKQVKKQQQLQKFWETEEVPLWWKSTTDRVLTTTVVGAGMAVFIVSCVNLYKYGAGTL